MVLHLKNNFNIWYIRNSLDVIHFIKNQDIHSIQVYDFENLFTSIPIDNLFSVLMNIFDDYGFVHILNISSNFFTDFVSFVSIITRWFVVIVYFFKQEAYAWVKIFLVQL